MQKNPTSGIRNLSFCSPRLKHLTRLTGPLITEVYDIDDQLIRFPTQVQKLLLKEQNPPHQAVFLVQKENFNSLVFCGNIIMKLEGNLSKAITDISKAIQHNNVQHIWKLTFISGKAFLNPDMILT